MAEQAYAYVTLIPVAKGFKSAITKELGGVGGVGTSVGSTTGKNFAGGFGKALGGLAAVAGTALAGIGISRFFKESITQASNLGESINAVNVAFGDSAQGILAFGATSAKELGVAAVDYNNAAVRFSAFADRIVGAGNDSSQFIADVTTRAADFASVFNIDVSEALQVFQSGLAGEAEPLKRFGINLLDSEVRAFALAEGIGEAGRQLTETEKVQARYGLLLQSTNKVQGDFKNTSDGLANSQRILQSTFKDLQAEIGENLTPVIATFVSALVPLSEKVFPAIAGFVNNSIVPGLTLFVDYFKELVLIGTTLGGDNVLAKIFKDITDSITNFFGGDTLLQTIQTIEELRGAIFDAMLKAVPGIVEAFVEFLPTLIDFFVNTMLPAMISEMETIVNEIISLITRLLPGLVETLLSMVPALLDSAITLFDTLIQAVIDITPDLVDAIVYLLPTIVESVLSMLPQILDAAIKLFTAIVMALPKIIPLLINAILDLLPVIIDTVIDMLPELIDAAFELFTGIVTAIFQATPQIQGAVGELIPKMIGTLLGAIPQFFQAGIDIIGGFIRGIVTKGPKLIGDAFSSVIGGAVEGVKGLLGIRSPSRVFQEFGVNIGEGLALGIDSQRKVVEDSATALGSSAKNGFAKSIDEIKEQFTAITNIPSLLKDTMDQVTEMTIADIRRMASEVEGFFALLDNSGKLLKSYTGYGVENLVPTAAGGQLDVGKLTDTLNSLQKAGYNNVAEAAFGGSTQQALDKLLGQQTFINKQTGMQTTVSGNLVGDALERVLGPGFEALPSLDKSVEELTDAIDSLNSQVADRGLTPFAKGGLVTGPTSALIGEAGPEVVIPLDRFESMMGMSDSKNKTVNYYAAPNQSIDSEQALFQAMRRAKVVANW